MAKIYYIVLIPDPDLAAGVVQGSLGVAQDHDQDLAPEESPGVGQRAVAPGEAAPEAEAHPQRRVAAEAEAQGMQIRTGPLTRRNQSQDHALGVEIGMISN